MNALIATPRLIALLPLRPHQERALAELRRSLMSGWRRPLLMLPTGGGKTLIAAHIAAGALAKGKRVAFVVPALSLIDQTVAAFEAESIHAIGVLQGIHPRTDRDAPIQICSVQTLARRRRPEVDLVIVDEAHQMHKEIFRWMKDCPNLIFIGLSATPWSRGLGKFYDALVIAATTRELIDAGYLSDFMAYAPSEPDLAGVRTVAGEFQQDELADAMDRPAITGDIISTWLQRGEDRPTIAFCVNRNHAKHVAERLESAGVAVEYIDGETSREDREAVFARFRSGATKILCSVGVLTTGFDADVRCIIDAQPTKSRILFVQKIGRGLRTAPHRAKITSSFSTTPGIICGSAWLRTSAKTILTTAKSGRMRTRGRVSAASPCRSCVMTARRSCLAPRGNAQTAARRFKRGKKLRRSTAILSSSARVAPALDTCPLRTRPHFTASFAATRR
jgi:DNA repair protein RadD